MDIRLAKISDIDEILVVLKEVVKHNPCTKWNSNYPNRDIITNDINNKDLYILIANEEIVGSVVLNSEEDINYNKVSWDKKGEALIIHRLFTSPKYAGKGYGKFMIEKCKEIARELEYDSIRLDTHQDNLPAQKLYEKLGFNNKGKIELDGMPCEFYVYEYIF